jgi:hypothetical protein
MVAMSSAPAQDATTLADDGNIIAPYDLISAAVAESFSCYAEEEDTSAGQTYPALVAWHLPTQCSSGSSYSCCDLAALVETQSIVSQNVGTLASCE